MIDRRLHRLYRHFQELPLSMRTLFTGTLLVIGMGYMFGLIYVYAQDAGRDGKPGLSVDDIIISYSGSSEGTKLEAALQGPMSSMLPAGDAAEIVSWIRSGAIKEAYEATVQPIVAQNCLDCHDGGNPHLSNLDGFDNISIVVAQDTGASLHTLVRVSHIHLFGMTFIFFIMGFIFSHAFIRPVWLKSLVVFIPFCVHCSRCKFLVFHQALHRVCMGRDDSGRGYGNEFRLSCGSLPCTRCGFTHHPNGSAQLTGTYRILKTTFGRCLVLTHCSV